jgi:ribosome biogenesis GTPase A
LPLVAESLETKLATDYEAIRRREYELITNLLELLPKIDNLEQERVAQVRDALFHADHPFLMVFVGPFNSGKSSIINALLGTENLLPVGPVPTTDKISILRWGEEPNRMTSGGDVDTVFYPSLLLKRVSFVDTPGLESIFKTHEEITRKFLHRSDVVLMVMLATQAMTASNLEYLQALKQYGKKVILIINQFDLLTSEETETVRQYVLEQSQNRLGFKPEVWLVSAKQGLEAHQNGSLDEAAWEASGLKKIEDYIDQQLNDVDRLRQKLQTPLQITQNVHQVALTAVKANQAALDHYQNIADNVEQQLAACKREQEKTIRDLNAEISEKFGAASMQGSEAIREIFRFSQAFRSIWLGLGELVGISRLFRRGNAPSYVHTAFERHKVFEPIAALPEIVEKLGPRLEGRDIQDIDDMVKYARREIDALPPVIRSKVIGAVQAPLKYDRSALQEIKPEMETIENEARELETDKLENTRRSTLLYLAVWEILVVIFGIALLSSWGAIGNEQPQLPIILLVILLALGMLGLVAMPIVGRYLETGYTNRMLKLQARYIDTLTKAADKQVAYGMQLRRDAVAPLTRLVEAQTQLQTEQLSKLQAAEQEMVKIESDLTKLGKRTLFGLGA